MIEEDTRILNEREKFNKQIVKDLGRNFQQILRDMGDSRELALANNKVEEAVMWAIKHITK
jgi:hypothetical protein